MTGSTSTRLEEAWSLREKHDKTMLDHHAFAAAGFKVIYVRENEFKETQRKVAPRSLLSILHVLPPLDVAGTGSSSSTTATG